MTNEIEKLKLSVPLTHNLTKPQRQALKQLQTYAHLTFKLLDKGGNVVVLDNFQYKHMCLKLLNNPTWYKSVPMTLVEQYTRDFYELVDTTYHDRIILQKVWEYIFTPFSTIATFYCLLKTHKSKAELSGWPIFSGYGKLT